MFRSWLVLATLSWGVASGAAPTYSADTIVNAANFGPGPFAPNSMVTIFGTDLCFCQPTKADPAPQETLGGVRVYVANISAYLLYVDSKQINFIVPSDLKTGTVPIRVVRQGVTGPEAMITLVSVAPQLFTTPDHYVIAQHGADYSMITPDSPACPNEVIVVYAIGLGWTAPSWRPGEIPANASYITSPLDVLLGGAVIGTWSGPRSDPYVWYAGLTPGWAGLYQINLKLPGGLDGDIEIRAASGGQISTAGVMLPMQLSCDGTR